MARLTDVAIDQVWRMRRCARLRARGLDDAIVRVTSIMLTRDLANSIAIVRVGQRSGVTVRIADLRTPIPEADQCVMVRR